MVAARDTRELGPRLHEVDQTLDLAGNPAGFLVLVADPLVDPLTLASPTLVVIRGVVQ